jgi:fluoride exporter
MRTALVAFGGLVGSVARFWLSGVVQRVNGSDFPVGTLAVNVLGSFVIGVVMALSLERGTVGPAVRLCLTVGFCGGFTTMSTWFAMGRWSSRSATSRRASAVVCSPPGWGTRSGG